MRSARSATLVALLVSFALAGCVQGDPAGDDDAAGAPPEAPTGPPDPDDVIQGVPVPVTAAAAGEDRRFGADRDLVREDLPGLAPVDNLTDYNTTRDYLYSMSELPEVTVFTVGRSIGGRILFGVIISDDGASHPERPTFALTCSQHGNEPSGKEGCLVMIEYLAHGVDAFAEEVRTKLNVAMIPMANPDGLDANRRTNEDGYDTNRDHMNMITPEAQGIHAFYNLYDAEFAIDLHEFGGSGVHSPTDTGSVSTYDYFEVAAPQTFYNHDEDLLNANYEIETLVAQNMSERHGVGSASHYGSSNSVSSIQRNHYGMHNSLSLLFETGGGSGVEAIDFRTMLQVDATFFVFEWVLADTARVKTLERDADVSSSTPQAGTQAWLAEPQPQQGLLIGLLEIHNITYRILEGDEAYLVTHYSSNPNQSAPQQRDFEAGTVFVDRFQADGRVAWEIFEAVHDQYYENGPRTWEMNVWRVVQ